MKEDKREKLDCTIEEFYNVLEKHKDDGEEMEVTYQRIQSLRDRRRYNNQRKGKE